MVEKWLKNGPKMPTVNNHILYHCRIKGEFKILQNAYHSGLILDRLEFLIEHIAESIIHFKLGITSSILHLRICIQTFLSFEFVHLQSISSLTCFYRAF